MIFRIPILYVGERQKGIAQVYTARPLFLPAPVRTAENLNRLTGKLARDLSEMLNKVGKEPRHDPLALLSFNPILSQHRLDVEIELRRRKVKVRFFFVVFKHLKRRVAFTPTVPDLWFELNRNESLKERATTVLSDHFRKLERHDPEIDPAGLSVTGTVWVSTLELSVRPPKVPPKKEESKFLMFGSSQQVDGHEELRRVGRCLDWMYPSELDRTLLRDSEVEELSRLLNLRDRRPILLIGPKQVGKTAIIHEYVYRTVSGRESPYRDKQNTWLISPQRLISGMSYVGQWEDRLLGILKAAKKRNHVLYFDDLLGLFLAGISASSTLNVAAVMKPYLERREFRMMGEISTEGFRVLQERDRTFADLFHLLPIRESSEEDSLKILLGVQRQLESKHLCNFDLDVLPTVIDIQRRYDRLTAFPGKAVKMFQQLAIKATRGEEFDSETYFRPTPANRAKITRDEVLKEFQAQSGLSLSFLDSRHQLESDTITESLKNQIIGQDPAVMAATDVIAIAKARLNDPERPLASFLFLGPTGVGKTECAKAIARTMFGDSDRLVRFDMNEYLDAGSAARLVGTFRQPEGLLTTAIRRQPFAVVLLDEIEKAHPEVFDLLLQVLGEGRLTDALGRTADFTNAFIIMTSNLGVREAEGRFGFQDDANASAAVYVKTAERFFRPEFFNRLDRVIPFRRLTREHVGFIAEKLIQDLLTREGFQQRKCLLNVDEQARERIVDFGYDPVLGARALKRAIEQQLTQPIASQLASSSLEAFTVISVFAGGATQLSELQIEVKPLEAVAPITKSASASRTAQERLRRLQATFKHVEKSFLHLRPPGPVTLGKLRPEDYRYFQLRDQFVVLRKQFEELKDRTGGQRHLKASTPAYTSAVRVPSSAQTIRIDGWLDHNVNGSLIREMAAADSIRDYLDDLATRQNQSVSESEYQDLELQLALLQASAEADWKKDSQMLLYICSPQGVRGWRTSRVLQVLYVAALTTELGVENQVVVLPVEEFWEGDYALIVRGLTARRFCELEAGTHLFSLAHQGYHPARVFAYPLVEGEDPIEVLRQKNREEDRWKTDRTGPHPFAFGPMVRIYTQPGNTIDLRTGTIVPTYPSTEALRMFLLSTLTIDWQEPEEEEEEILEQERRSARRSRAAEFEEE